MAGTRAPKQWSLSKVETITSFEAWRQNSQYTLSLDQNFAAFLVDGFTWLKKTNANPLRGIADDGEEVAEAKRRTAAQNIFLEPNERPEDLFQRLASFIEDNLLRAGGNIHHHGEVPEADEELSPSLENLIVLTWLRLIYRDLPNLVKQRYGTELRSKTLASLKPEISQALDSLLDEIHSATDAKVLRASIKDKHFDRSAKKSGSIRTGRQIKCFIRVSTKQSPYFKAFYKHFPLELTLDTGAEVSMIKASSADYIGVTIKKSNHSALQADGVTPLNIVGECHFTLSRDGIELQLEALVVNDLDVDILAGIPFMSSNDIAIFPSKHKIVIRDKVTVMYGSPNEELNSSNTRVRRTQAFLIRAPSASSVVWPGCYGEYDIPSEIESDCILAIEPHTDASRTKDWPSPQIAQSVAGKIRIVNNTSVPQFIQRNEHFCRVRLTTTVDNAPEAPDNIRDLKTTNYIDTTHTSHFFQTTDTRSASIIYLVVQIFHPTLQAETHPYVQSPNCQVCCFISRTEDSVVRAVSIQDVLNDEFRLPFTTRSAWINIQSECPDLRRTHAHLKQGTRPSKKLTNIKDVKRYLNVASIAKDGLLVVRRCDPLAPPNELIIVPRSVLDGLVTALHIKLDHPSKHQLNLVLKRPFYALDMPKAAEQASDSCHTCASLKRFPKSLVEQSSEDPPDLVGISYVADVLKRNRQLILVVRETVTSYTSTCFIKDEKLGSLRDGLIHLLIPLKPLNGPSVVVRVDPAPGFRPLCDDSYLKKLNISIEIGRVKNQNKNPVADKAIAELEDELLREERDNSLLSENTLVIATTRINSRLRQRGLSSRELWTQRSNQLRASSYKVKLSECYKVLNTISVHRNPRYSQNEYNQESDCDDYDEDGLPGPICDLPPVHAEPPPILICENIDDVEKLDEPTGQPDNSLERVLTHKKPHRVTTEQMETTDTKVDRHFQQSRLLSRPQKQSETPVLDLSLFSFNHRYRIDERHSRIYAKFPRTAEKQTCNPVLQVKVNYDDQKVVEAGVK
ncbi:unnamed protein product [Mytilus coruscus]|uniref:Uncharacterized protein n=1 Tax=Mytilus coruscus TaxID=42192 RepID=A0A6J8D0A0_MYTCO|nr:unnamed protein product [Mytilus coruscus]